jgi:hypothetical protein
VVKVEGDRSHQLNGNHLRIAGGILAKNLTNLKTEGEKNG